MARETKVGLLLGMALILLVGIILSDLMSDGGPDAPEAGSEFANNAQRGLGNEPAFTADPAFPDRPEPTYRPEVIQRDLPPAPIDPPQRTVEPTPFPALPEPSAVEAAGDSTQRAQLPSAWRVTDPLNLDARPSASTYDPMPAEVAEASAGQGEFIHYVQNGETLADIARQYYANAEFAQAIAWFNSDTLDRDASLRAGQRIEIPPLDAPVFERLFKPVHATHAVRVDNDLPELPRQDRKALPSNNSSRQITVAPGDTLSGLAAVHLGSGDRWRELLEANSDQIGRPEDLRAGMTLNIPNTTSRSEATVTAEPAPRSISINGADPRRTYTVKAGDNLTRIANRELGDGDRWRDILEANRDVLSDADDIYAGMTLKLPGQPIATTSRPSESPAASSQQTYTVQAGDTLIAIAQRQLRDGDQWRDILAVNSDQLSRPEDLKAGMRLVMP
jgi:nucleoid-associated protein YgaU